MIKHLASRLLPLTNSSTAAQQEAWWLLEHVTGKSKAQLLLDCTLTNTQEKQLAQLLQLRITQQMPLAYVLGTVPFGELTLAVRPPILIPRHETEEICEWVVKQVQSDVRILDIGTGSGCIALYLAHALPKSTVTGVDSNPASIELAIENKIRNKVSNAQFVLGDVFSDVSLGTDPGSKQTTPFNLIISNPPYVTEDEYAELDTDVARWEDKNALVAEDNGLAFYKKIISMAPQHLTPDGMLVFEIGTAQGAAVSALMKAASFTAVTVHQDSFGHDRWVIGKRG